MLDDVLCEGLLVIVIDALDECGGLWHDSSGIDDFEGLVHMLKCWVQVDHLKKLKVVITSRPEDSITFSDPISIHEIPSGRDVKPGDSTSEDIRTFLKLRLESMYYKLYSAISPSILHQFSRSQWLRKALKKTFR